MKKTLPIVMLIVVAVLLVSCSSTTTLFPYSASVSFPAEGTYKVLGRVSYTASKGNTGYIPFLEYVKTKYPTADDVVNILVDSEQTIQSSFMPGVGSKVTSSTYTMTGIAIEYLNF